MSILYIIVSVSFTTISLALKMCPESIPTVSIVNRCPSSATEWALAAKRKSCYDLGQLQSCTNKADDFVYHCVLNENATMLLEVCAPTYLLSGHCACFSEADKQIKIVERLDCTKFDPPCSTRLRSNESYEYQTCYRNAGEKPKGCEASQEKNLHITTAIVISVIFAIIILILLIIIGVGCNMSRKKKGKNNAVDEGNNLLNSTA